MQFCTMSHNFHYFHQDLLTILVTNFGYNYNNVTKKKNKKKNTKNVSSKIGSRLMKVGI